MSVLILPRRGHGDGGGEESIAAVILAGSQGVDFLRGDANGDSHVDVSDPVALLRYLFLEAVKPSCSDTADVNDDGVVDIADPTAVLLNLFLGGTALPEPYPLAGLDPTPDALACEVPER